MTHNVAQGGEEKHAGHDLASYAIEKPEGMYHFEGNELQWKEPEDENFTIGISVRDGGDGRTIPALDMQLTRLDPDGNEAGTHTQPFLWHPLLYPYGRSWKLPVVNPPLKFTSQPSNTSTMTRKTANILSALGR